MVNPSHADAMANKEGDMVRPDPAKWGADGGGLAPAISGGRTSTDARTIPGVVLKLAQATRMLRSGRLQ